MICVVTQLWMLLQKDEALVPMKTSQGVVTKQKTHINMATKLKNMTNGNNNEDDN